MNSQSGRHEAITKSYSYNLVVKSTLVLLAGTLITGLLLYYSVYRGPGSSYAESYSIIADLRAQLFYRSAVIYVTTSVFVALGIITISLLYSHRVAGPVYRLDMFARQVSSGDFSQSVKLREHDAIHNIADDMNGLVAAYRGKIVQLEEKTEGLKEVCFSTVSGPTASMSGEDRDKAIAVIAQKTDEINRIINDIKL